MGIYGNLVASAGVAYRRLWGTLIKAGNEEVSSEFRIVFTMETLIYEDAESTGLI